MLVGTGHRPVLASVARLSRSVTCSTTAAHGPALARYPEKVGPAILAAFFAAAVAPTFSHDVAPLLYTHCAGCHHTGGVAPFPLLTYSDAAKRAPLIASVTANRSMPPWL